MEDITMLQNVFEGFTLNQNWLLWGLLIGIAIDFITGIAKGYIIDGKPDSSQLRSGMFKKAGILLVVTLGYGLSVLFSDVNCVVAHGILCYYIYMELISILENLTQLGVPLPKVLKKVLGENKIDTINKTNEDDKKEQNTKIIEVIK